MSQDKFLLRQRIFIKSGFRGHTFTLRNLLCFTLIPPKKGREAKMFGLKIAKNKQVYFKNCKNPCGI